MARTQSYRELIAWQKAMQLAQITYAIANGLPRKEAFGLTAQIQRAAVSIPSNIAEGHGRLTDLQFRHFLGNPRGSLCELQTQIELAHNFGCINAEPLQNFMSDAREAARLINGLITALRIPPGKPKEPLTPLTAPSAANPASSASKGKHS